MTLHEKIMHIVVDINLRYRPKKVITNFLVQIDRGIITLLKNLLNSFWNAIFTDISPVSYIDTEQLWLDKHVNSKKKSLATSFFNFMY